MNGHKVAKSRRRICYVAIFNFCFSGSQFPELEELQSSKDEENAKLPICLKGSATAERQHLPSSGIHLFSARLRLSAPTCVKLSVIEALGQQTESVRLASLESQKLGNPTLVNKSLK